MGAAARPDAVLIPSSYKRGSNSRQKIHSILDVADEVLRTDKAAGEKTYYRNTEFRAPDGSHYNLATRGPLDTMLHPTGHPGEKTPRYRWEDGEGGLRLGYLLEPEVIIGQS